MSWQLDYKRAWETWAKPEFLKLPEEVKQLVRYVAIQCEGRHQNKSLGMDWFGDMKERFAAIDTETLRKAAVVIYNYGHWYHSRYAKNTNQAWLEPDYLADANGGSWKFDLFAKQHLAVERRDTRLHLSFDQMVDDKFDYYTHDEGTDLCDDELRYKYKELVKPMFEAVNIVVVNVQVKDCHLEPHLFVIGTAHFPKDGGMYINVHQSRCSHCKLPYENHTHEKALGLRLLRDIPKTEGAAFLKTLTSSMEQDKLVGFAFYKGYKFIGGSDMTKKQEELAEKHGTPEQFEKAIWKACDDLTITTQEAVAAINGYKFEWMQAGHTANDKAQILSEAK